MAEDGLKAIFARNEHEWSSSMKAVQPQGECCAMSRLLVELTAIKFCCSHRSGRLSRLRHEIDEQ